MFQLAINWAKLTVFRIDSENLAPPFPARVIEDKSSKGSVAASNVWDVGNWEEVDDPGYHGFRPTAHGWANGTARTETGLGWFKH
jgi:hypothetical protein